MPSRGLLTLLILLLLLNALLLATVLGAFGADPLAGWMESPREPQRLGQQVRTERFVPADAANPAGASAPAAAPAPGPASAPAAQLAPNTTGGTLAAAPAQGQCVEIGGLSTDAARELTLALAGAGHIEHFERQELVRWWIHLPAQPSRDQVQRKLGELQRRNITDVSVVAAGSPETFTVSLGLFRERERAERYLDELRGHGVRTAVLSDAPRQLTRQWLRVRDVDAAQRGRLDEARRRFGAAELQSCA